MAKPWRFLAVLFALGLVLAACNGGADGSPGASDGGAAASICDDPPEQEPVEDENLGGEISIIAVYADAEQESFEAMIQPWVDRTGVTVNYESTRDINAVLTTRLAGGNPPDVAGLPGPGQMAQYAADGELVPLTGVIDVARMCEEYGENWINLGSADGEYVGIFTKTSLKGPIWYNPQAFEAANYTVPEDYEGLQTLVQQIADSGTTPWGIGLESDAASGWPGTDWVEDFLLRQAGPDVYNAWWAGEQAWTSDEVRAAFESFGAWATTDEMVSGGPNNALNTNFGNGGDCLFAEPPGCYLHHQASFITGFFQDNFPDEAVAGETFDFFMFPEIEYNGVVAAGDLFGMFNDTPQARSLMDYLTTAEAQQIWVERGGALSPNQSVDLNAYPDDISRKSAEALTGAETVVFDGSDLMPADMNAAFWGAILDYVQNPENLDAILEDLDGVQERAYR
jgi:alpha-glucoside transport system substrate-binding protein